jgi:uncharacterized damage-inducible protein DinB
MESLDWPFLLKEGFGYDYYANGAWVECVLTSGNEEAIRVFKHILGASEIWLKRLDGISLTVGPDLAISIDALADLRDRWMEAIERLEYGDFISYSNLAGQPFPRCFGDIARHVVNHGTYHRGQIRQIFGSNGIDFPDTDVMGFSFHRDGV